MSFDCDGRRRGDLAEVHGSRVRRTQHRSHHQRDPVADDLDGCPRADGFRNLGDSRGGDGRRNKFALRFSDSSISIGVGQTPGTGAIRIRRIARTAGPRQIRCSYPP
jgi:hypothetical protein